MAVIKCLKPPVVKVDEGVVLGTRGHTAEIQEVTHYWQGQIARGNIEIVNEEPVGDEPKKAVQKSKKIKDGDEV